MQTLLRRAALALVTTLALAACTPTQMATWMKNEGITVPKNNEQVEEMAEWADAWWLALAEAAEAAAAEEATRSAIPGWPWSQLVQCEASGNWHIANGNGYYGGLQFAHSTWVSYGGQAFAAYAHQASPGQQVEIAQRIVAAHGGTYGAWPGCRATLGLP